MRTFLLLTSTCLVLLCGPLSASPKLQTRNVIVVVADGLRWQEVFSGADPQLLNESDGGSWQNATELRRKYWNDDLEERRKLLFPFFWNVIARQGQLIGNQNKGNIAHVTNGLAFSYPGYNELLTGHPDSRIDSNEFGPNPNVTVFEWLNRFPEWHDRTAVFGTWDVFKNIFNQQRSHLYVQAGWDFPLTRNATPRQALLQQLFQTTTRLEDNDLWDSFLQVLLLDYLKASQPSLLFVGYGETDSWAHAGRYDLVLESAHQVDGFIQQLWTTIQAIPKYRDQTTLIVTTDHGRGSGKTEWKEHGIDQKGSENIWIAALGPDVTPLGERTNAATVAQSQIAATVAALLGQNFQIPGTRISPPIDDLIGTNGNHHGPQTKLRFSEPSSPTSSPSAQ